MNSNAKKWVEALQSGEYVQCKEQLEDGKGGYCCLGVVCRVYEKENGLEPVPMLNLDGIYDEDLSAYIGVQEWLGLKSCLGFYSELESLAGVNDTSSDFEDVVAIIISEPEGLFVEEVV